MKLQHHVSGISLLVFIHCLPASVLASVGTSSSWQAKMKALSQTMQELLPELTAKKPDIGKIKREAKNLSVLAHSIHQSTSKNQASLPDRDPSVDIFSSMFEKETKRALESIEGGHVEYSRQVLRGVTGYCIACHTRNAQGPRFLRGGLTKRAASMEPIERAELFAATRQFDAALDEYKKLISDGNYAKDHPMDWERGLREAVAISVRVKKDPALSMEFINRVKGLPNVPEFVSQYVSIWKISTREWRNEPAPVAITDEGLNLLAAKLLSDARALQKYPVDHSGDILYLRASAVAHDLLSRAPNGPLASRALLMEGMAYEVLNNPLVWPVHEMYYEACVRKSPHTEIAQECYDRFESSVFFGYSGSGGTFIPPDIESTLEELKGLSYP